MDYPSNPEQYLAGARELLAARKQLREALEENTKLKTALKNLLPLIARDINRGGGLFAQSQLDEARALLGVKP